MSNKRIKNKGHLTLPPSLGGRGQKGGGAIFEIIGQPDGRIRSR